MALVGVELETLVFEPDTLTTRPPPCAGLRFLRFLSSKCTSCSSKFSIIIVVVEHFFLW